MRPSGLGYWKERKELYATYYDGCVNVYRLESNIEKIVFTSSFKIHEGGIHRMQILEDLNYIMTSGYDSTLRIWRPPAEWEQKIVVTISMIEGIDPQENLSTIKEEKEDSKDSLKLVYAKHVNITDDPTDKAIEILGN